MYIDYEDLECEQEILPRMPQKLKKSGNYEWQISNLRMSSKKPKRKTNK